MWLVIDSRARPLLHSLPLPLAQLLLRALNAKSAIEQHHCAYYLLEASIKLAAAARAGAWLATNPPAEVRLLLPLTVVGGSPQHNGHPRGAQSANRRVRFVSQVGDVDDVALLLVVT